MKATRANEKVAHNSDEHPKIPALAAAGIVGPVLFTIGVLVQQFYRSGTYDPIAQMVSDLTAGPYGWVQQVNFLASRSVIADDPNLLPRRGQGRSPSPRDLPRRGCRS